MRVPGHHQHLPSHRAAFLPPCFFDSLRLALKYENAASSTALFEGHVNIYYILFVVLLSILTSSSIAPIARPLAPSHDGTLPCTRASFRALDCAAACPLHPCKLRVRCRGWLGRGCARLEPLQLHQMVQAAGQAAGQAPDARKQLRCVDGRANPARALQLQHSCSLVALVLATARRSSHRSVQRRW